MQHRPARAYQNIAGWSLLALAIPLLWWVSHPARQVVIEPATFVFWHSVIELFAVVVAMLVFVTGYRAILSARKGAVVLLGVAFLGVGLLDFLHTMSYAGMPLAVTVNTPQKSIFFWLAARALAAGALLAYAWLPTVPRVTRRKKRLALVLMLVAVGLVGYVGLFWPDRMPALFVDGHGLTPLKIGLEWLIVATHLATLAVLWCRRKALAHECVMSLAFAAALSVVSELFLTMLGVVDKDGANMLGHLYKVAAYLYLFHATFNEALRRPLARMASQHLREKATLAAARDGVLWVDNTGRILMGNPAMAALSGYSLSELPGQNVDIFLPEHLRSRHAQSMRGYFTAPDPGAMKGLTDLKLRHRDGHLLPVDVSLSHWEEDGDCYVIAHIHDLSERKQAERVIRESTQRLSLHFQSTPLAVIEWDTNFCVVEWNPAAERIFGYTKAEALGRHAMGLTLPVDAGPQIEQIWSDLLTGRGGSRSSNDNCTKDGTIIHCDWYNTQLVDANGRVVGVASLAQDATERKLASERLSYLAYYDDLTALPNRVLFKERLAQDLGAADKMGHSVGVMFLDIDHFKDVNDTLGHEAGNLLLQATAGRLQACLRSGDLAARFGGDEFAVILAKVAHLDEATQVAQHVFDRFKEPIDILGHALFVTFSMGITLYPADDGDVETMLRNAHSAMYSAKAGGRNDCQFYSATMTERAARHLALQTGLRRALENEEFILHYQPQLACETGRIIGVEALVRWRNSDKGMVSPAQFIPVAEETGLIVPIGEWVLLSACLQAKAWQAQGLPHMRVAVNLSARQFKDPLFPERVLAIVNQSGLDPRFLELEITESILVDGLDSVNAVLQSFKQAGIMISLDDFGTGYSSLSYLKRFPIDKLKIDQSFVRDVLTDVNDASLVRAVIAMARALRLKVIAEGVETQGQFDFLRADGCDELQGYHIARPMPAEHVFDFVARHHAACASHALITEAK